MQTFLEYTSFLLIVLLAVYVRQILYFFRGLARLTAGKNTYQHSVTVIIPARNEEKNIERVLNSLLRQNYPREKLAIIVIDDQSDDRTSLIVNEIAQNSPITMTLLQSDITSTIRSPKIRAMTLGIQHSMSEIIVTTDADCIASSGWISTINSYFEEHDVAAFCRPLPGR